MRIIYNSSKMSFSTVFLTFYFCVSALSKMFEHVGIPRTAFYAVYVILLALYVLLNLGRLKNKADVAVVYAILTPTVLYSCIYMRDVMNGETALYALVLNFYPAYFMMRVTEQEVFLKGLVAGSYISLVVYVFQVVMQGGSGSSYLGLGYDLLMPLCVVTYNAILKKGKARVLLVIVATVMLALFGSRGALVVLVVFLLYCFASTLGRAKTIGIICALVVFAVVFADFDCMLDIVRSFGFESRTLDKLESSSFFQSESRLRLYEYLWKLLPSSVLGYGPFGSRSLMPVFYDTLRYPYPHSIFFELLLDYGVILGLAIFAYMIYAVFLSVLLSRTDDEKLITGVVCIACLAPLFVSGTFYTTWALPFVIANYFNLKSRNRVFEKNLRECSIGARNGQ